MRGVDAQCIHGDIPQEKREKVMAIYLLSDGLAAVEADHADAGLELGKIPHFGGDLHGQFPGGG